jgi:hypothetical protein
MTQFLNPLYRITDTLNPPQLMASTDLLFAVGLKSRYGRQMSLGR